MDGEWRTLWPRPLTPRWRTFFHFAIATAVGNIALAIGLMRSCIVFWFVIPCGAPLSVMVIAWVAGWLQGANRRTRGVLALTFFAGTAVMVVAFILLEELFGGLYNSMIMAVRESSQSRYLSRCVHAIVTAIVITPPVGILGFAVTTLVYARGIPGVAAWRLRRARSVGTALLSMSVLWGNVTVIVMSHLLLPVRIPVLGGVILCAHILTPFSLTYVIVARMLLIAAEERRKRVEEGIEVLPEIPGDGIK